MCRQREPGALKIICDIPRTTIMAMFESNIQSGVSSSPVGSPGGAILNRNMIHNKIYTNQLKRICTWNVKTLAQAGKLHCALKEMDRMKISIMGVSEMRWPDASYCDIEEYRVYYSGSTNGKYVHGVGVIMHKSVANHVTNFVPVNERVLLIQINASPVNMNIIQVYAPTTEYSDEHIQEFYNHIDTLIKNLPKHEMLVVMGDFNAKIGKGREGVHVGPHGLGERNERGETFNVFAAEHNLIVLNTFYKLPHRRLYTWTSPRDNGEDTIIRNQIDYILVNKRFRNSFTSVKTYPGADIKSDHNPLVGEYRTKWKKIQKKTIKKHDMRKLKSRIERERISKILNEKCREIEVNMDDTEDKIQSLSKAVEDIKDKFLKTERKQHKSWMTEEILLMMEERRKHKNNVSTYKLLDRDIQRKIREAKQKELDEKCHEIERLQQKYDEFNVHKKVREITGKYKKRTVGKLVNDNGDLIVDQESIKNTWRTYIQNLFFDERGEPPSLETETGPPILVNEVKAAITSLRDGKAPGPDGMQAEFLKLLDEESVKMLSKIFNNIYDSGNIPKDWLISEFIMLPKKQGAKRCGEYRTISLMSHLLKLFLKIIHRRIYRICEERVTDTQFGFMKGVGTRDALFSLQVLFQRCRDMNCNIYTCFIDYQKAFDKIQHQKMMEVLQNTGMDDKDLRIIRNLYWNQAATIKINSGEETTEAINILRGVRQGNFSSDIQSLLRRNIH
uniref:Craniofacial development protein 2 n=1 Tax=Cacopsylla melanoneura TaxID=428564 RepID=A0A8D8Z4U1_9HEMI